jgi:hypothetical protein
VAPAGWSALFAERVREVVLDGYSAFGAADARAAAARLLAGGPVRVKDVDGVGGVGQTVVSNQAEFEQLLASHDAAALARVGLVLERNLHEVRTHSVGQVVVGPWQLSYVGHQSLTRNHRDHEVYGGSTLRVVRGDFDALHALPLDAAERTAIGQALVYHRAAMASFPGLFASRSNYDVAQGVDDDGRRHSGVLEQSWRIGGASGAELAALEAMCADPMLAWVQASTHEVYADSFDVPQAAQVHYDGTDPHVGRLVKYAVVDARGHA